MLGAGPGEGPLTCNTRLSKFKELILMNESYGHRIAAIHANPKNLCDHCRQTALWETDYMFYGEHSTQSSHPGQVCDVHAKEFAAKWPSIEFRAQK
jgi:hypothetical protein